MRAQSPARQQTTITCYAFFEKIFPECGLLDYTEGMYYGDPKIPYETAQRNQIRYLLDEVSCGPGTRLLDVGCGNGNLLEEAETRGARAIGITISPEQVKRCQARGLNARLLDYKNLSEVFTGCFDSVIANGPIEHFVHPEDAIQGRTDQIYHSLFEIMHRVIDPHSKVRKAVNTTINFVRQPDPRDLLKSFWTFPRGSENFHWSILERSFGGYYPALGQLEACSSPYFQLTKTVDGTQDYCFTSEDWLRRVKAQIRNVSKLPRMVARSLPLVLGQFRQCSTMLMCMLISESWNWQFRSDNPPTRLLRQTWQYR